MPYLGLLVFLVVFWLGLSGHYTNLLLILGGLSIAFSFIMALRMKTIDNEGAPYRHFFGVIGYGPYLFKEIFKANISVIRTILAPDLKISPSFVLVSTKTKTTLGRTLFANSITLTPGTVSVDFAGDKILVHALEDSAEAPDAFTEMDEKATKAVE